MQQSCEMSTSSIINEDALHEYISHIKKIPILTEDEELELANRWKKKGDQKALDKIIACHLKLVLKIAKSYAGYGLSLSDLISEGNLGIMHAVKHFDPTIGYRFSTYAAWWIKSKIQDFVYNSWSIVKLSATKNNRKLFFGLRKMKTLLGINKLNEQNTKILAEKMDVTPEEIQIADIRLNGKDFSANSPVGESGESSWQDFLVDNKTSPDIAISEQQEIDYRKNVLNKALKTLSDKEQQILYMHRLMNPPKTLQEIAKHFNLSAERVRQIDKQAFSKIQKYITVNMMSMS
ncbi:MAG: sigma-70 family RNA polymerase sigma factor [Alphaproteobacteria bacterium]|nr:sigma-70 family RNA polymerase sigma factor [Alphaproteobacteria bacterium]